MAKWGNIGLMLFKTLRDDSPVAAIYGSHIFPISNATNTASYPCIVYTITDIEPSNTKGDAAQGKSTLDIYEVQIALFHTTYGEMIDGMEVVRDALDYKQDFTTTVDGVDVVTQSISLMDTRQDFMDEFDDNGLWVTYMDYRIRQKLN